MTVCFLFRASFFFGTSLQHDSVDIGVTTGVAALRWPAAEVIQTITLVGPQISRTLVF